MNSLYLFFQRIKGYFTRNKLVFCLFLLGGIINTIAVIYSYGNLLPSIANRNTQTAQYRAYIVVLNETPANLADVEKLAEDPLVEVCAFTDGNGAYTYKGNFPLVRLNGTLTFSNPYEVIVPQLAQESVGDEVMLYGKPFRVIGTASSAYGSYFIPYETFLELGDTDNITTLHLYSATQQSGAEDRIVTLVSKLLPHYTSIGGDAIMSKSVDARLTRSMSVLIGVAALVAMIAQAFLLHHLLDSMRGANITSMILGASRGKIISMTFYETLLLCGGSTGLGIFVHRVLYEPVFRSLNTMENIVYFLDDYCLIFLFMMLLSLAVMLPVVIKQSWVSPVRARQRYL